MIKRSYLSIYHLYFLLMVFNTIWTNNNQFWVRIVEVFMYPPETISYKLEVLLGPQSSYSLH